VSTVFVIEDGKARQQIVALGLRKDKVIEILEGLKGGEILATSNVNQLATGSNVLTDAEAENGPGRAGRRGGRGRRGEGASQ
jgi:hypothetical protein